jgi:hypothetical protein
MQKSDPGDTSKRLLTISKTRRKFEICMELLSSTGYRKRFFGVKDVTL